MRLFYQLAFAYDECARANIWLILQTVELSNFRLRRQEYDQFFPNKDEFKLLISVQYSNFFCRLFSGAIESVRQGCQAAC